MIAFKQKGISEGAVCGDSCNYLLLLGFPGRIILCQVLSCGCVKSTVAE